MTACHSHAAHVHTVIKPHVGVIHVHVHTPFESTMVQHLQCVVHKTRNAGLSCTCVLYGVHLCSPLTPELTQKLNTGQEFSLWLWLKAHRSCCHLHSCHFSDSIPLALESGRVNHISLGILFLDASLSMSLKNVQLGF